MSKTAGGLPSMKEIVSPKVLETSAGIIREAFETVARDFGLTTENNPTHPSFITAGQLSQMKARGMRLFGLFQSDIQVGFVAMGAAGNDIYNLEKLAVLPGCRHAGYGRALIRFALDFAKLEKPRK